jgi:hypothetical protein
MYKFTKIECLVLLSMQFPRLFGLLYLTFIWTILSAPSYVGSRDTCAAVSAMPALQRSKAPKEQKTLEVIPTPEETST